MITVKRNQTYGQLYLENRHNGDSIRIPTYSAAAFHEDACLDGDDVRRLREGQTLSLRGSVDDYRYLAG